MDGFCENDIWGMGNVEGQWVFGGIERSTGKIFLVPVEKRDRETLTAIIVKWITRDNNYVRLLESIWQIARNWLPPFEGESFHQFRRSN